MFLAGPLSTESPRSKHSFSYCCVSQLPARVTCLKSSVCKLGLKNKLVCSVHELTGQSSRLPFLPDGRAGLNFLESLATARELFQNRFDGGGPNKGTGLVVPRFEEFVDGSNEVGNARERVTTDSLGCEFSKPALD